MNKLSKRVKRKKYFANYYKKYKKKTKITPQIHFVFPLGLAPEEKKKQEKLIELQNNIKEINLILLDFQFKKSTRQPIKPHEIKTARKKRVRLITKYWEIYSADAFELAMDEYLNEDN